MEVAPAVWDTDTDEAGPLLCPSAQPDEDAVVIAIVGKRNASEPVTMLPRPIPLDAVVHLVPESMPATDMLRLAAPCAERRCGHFDNGRCMLASRVARLPELTDGFSPCSFRSICRWWRQEGAAVCRRCPQITDDPSRVSDLLRRVTEPAPAPSEAA
jgi:hypothetical protein